MEKLGDTKKQAVHVACSEGESGLLIGDSGTVCSRPRQHAWCASRRKIQRSTSSFSVCLRERCG
jgi:hypothetical protein